MTSEKGFKRRDVEEGNRPKSIDGSQLDEIKKRH